MNDADLFSLFLQIVAVSWFFDKEQYEARDGPSRTSLLYYHYQKISRHVQGSMGMKSLARADDLPRLDSLQLFRTFTRWRSWARTSRSEST